MPRRSGSNVRLSLYSCRPPPSASFITATLELMPSREAPFSMSRASSSVRIPPDALTASPSGASSRARKRPRE